jgi:hypothetical protein
VLCKGEINTDIYQDKSDRTSISRILNKVKLLSIQFRDWFNKLNEIPWSESAIELYRPSDRRLSAK